MSSTIRRPVQLLAVLLVALLASPVLGVVSADPADAATRGQQKIQRRLHNVERKAHARPPLKLNRKLSRIARLHSLRMARRDRLYHNPRLVRHVRARGLRFRRLGENVGVAPSRGVATTLSTVHNAFLNSPPHRRNVLNRAFRRMGVGVAGGKGKLWVTVVFMG